jgi:hypothetical protein
MVERVSAPLLPPVAEIVHRVCKHQEQRLGCTPAAREVGGKSDAATLDHAGADAITHHAVEASRRARRWRRQL